MYCISTQAIKTTVVLLLDKTVRMLVLKSSALYYNISITETTKRSEKASVTMGEGRIGGHPPPLRG